jgi:hypothetical protein
MDQPIILPPSPAARRAPVPMPPPTQPNELRILITPVEGKVQMEFGRDIGWLQLTPEQARDMADNLLSAANRAAQIILAPK